MKTIKNYKIFALAVSVFGFQIKSPEGLMGF